MHCLMPIFVLTPVLLKILNSILCYRLETESTEEKKENSELDDKVITWLFNYCSITSCG